MAVKIKRSIWLLFLCLVLVFHAASIYAQEEISEGEATFNFVDVDIRSVIKSVAKITGKNFIINPTIKGKVTIISSMPVDDEEVYGLFLSVLQVHDLAALETGKVVKIVPLDRAKQALNAIETGDKLRRPEDRQVTSIIRLEHVPADRVVAILRPMVPAKSYLAAHPDSNILIISDRAGNVNRMMRMVQKIDQITVGEIEVIQLNYGDARDIVAVIEGLETKAAKGQARSKLRLIADDRTNSILLSGTEQYRQRARTLIAHLDSPIEAEGSTQVVFLRFANAKDLVPILSGVDVAEKSTVGKGAAAAAAQRQRNKGVVIQADEATNALIITAPPATMKSLHAVIRKLDIRRVQVLIEAVIAEVTTDKGAQLGIQWRSTDSISATSNGVIGGTNFSGSNQVGINSINEATIGQIGLVNGFNLGYFRGTTEIFGTEFLNLAALISAVASDTDTNILSTPTLVTLDNEEAEIIVGQNVPFATGSFTTTASTTPDNPFTTFERQDVGLKLQVKPQINEGDTIRLDITQEVSDLTTQAIGGQPITNTRSIKTVVMVDDGKILVLGGLIDDSVEEVVTKVPLLGDIPFLGALFRFTSTNHEKQNLMVFLRPVILKDENTSSKITFDKYDYMRRLQQNYNEDGINLMPNAVAPELPGFEEYPNLNENNNGGNTIPGTTEDNSSSLKNEPTTIYDIDVEKTSAETRVHVMADGPLDNYRNSILAKTNSLPDRLYVDFPHARIDLPDSRFEVNTTLARIRMAQRENGGRIVFDSGIDELFDYKLYPESNGLTIIIPEKESSELNDNK